MLQHRRHISQLTNRLFLTDGGLETTLIFHEGLTLPEFAAFDLLKQTAGYQALQRYFRTYADLACRYQTGLILESATWRANPDWGAKLGYAAADLDGVNQKAIALLEDIRQEYIGRGIPMVISGCVGPRGDGYIADAVMSSGEAATYHLPQIQVFRQAGADLVSAITMTTAEEAIGVVLAAQSVDMPVVISFTVETDGNLPSGQSLKAAIAQVDWATGSGPIYYMINCAHPTHFANVFAEGEPWLNRIGGLRANASTKSHAELDVMETLDDGNPAELGRQYGDLKQILPNLNVLGGCCGTDERHVEAICQAAQRCFGVGALTSSGSLLH